MCAQLHVIGRMAAGTLLPCEVVHRFALVFPGQGSQYAGMGQALAYSSEGAGDIFRAADEALGEPLSELCFNGPADELDQTVNAQPAILEVSIALLRALEERLGGPLQPAFMAGHSMGQYSAMVAAGVISLEDGVRLVRERGRQMQASARDGAMAAVLGLDEARIPELLAAGQAAGEFTVANRNSPGQIVVSGTRAAVDAAVAAARDLGARRAVVLPVSVAAHSPLMARAAEAMQRVLSHVEFHDPRVPLLANASAHPLTTAEACRAELVEHLTRGVDWVAAVEHMTGAGVDAFAEVGPGKVLTGLIKRIAPDAEAVAVDDSAAPGGLAVPDFLSDPHATGAAS
jgi:[acyl-carrier-protein] S-malonyltransferase